MPAVAAVSVRGFRNPVHPSPLLFRGEERLRDEALHVRLKVAFYVILCARSFRLNVLSDICNTIIARYLLTHGV